MSRITKAFEKKAFVAYLTMGQKSLEQSYEMTLALHKGGANVIELGVPFSDPVADGPVIQQAAQEAIAQGTTLNAILETIAKIRAKAPDLALILFSYYNPILNAGYAFYSALQKAGADGILIVDLPLEESEKHVAACREHNIAPIQIISAVTPEARMSEIAKQGDGFLYYACRKGTTGMQAGLPANYTSQVALIKKHSTLPVATGFGISDKTMAADVLKASDGFVVGSYFVDAINKGATLEKITELANNIDPRSNV
jgi:tryptophan synthase alpha chain